MFLSQIQSALQNLELCKKASMPVSMDMERKFQDQNRAGATLLLEMLELRGALERSLVLVEPVPRQKGEEPCPPELERQNRYVKLHTEVIGLRDVGTDLSKKKVGHTPSH